MKKRKFRKGKPIRSLDELSMQQWVFLHDRPKHAGFIQSMQFRTVRMLMEMGRICRAENNDDDDA